MFAGSAQLFLIKRCRAISPDMWIVVFSSLPARPYEREAISAGADAYLTKEHDLAKLIALMSNLTQNASTPRASREIDNLRDRHPSSPSRIIDGVHLTPREIQIAQLLSLGLSASRIAANIGVSANTAAVHRDNIRKKLNCRDTPELIARLARIFGDSHRHE